MDNLISYKGFHWEYIEFGTGPETLFVFHGFDNDAGDFMLLEKYLPGRFRIISINLFFHGRSFVEEGAEAVFTEEDLKDLFSHFLFEFKCDKFSLMGFSLGGRIALKLLEQFPERINAVYLLAPDGLRINGWYKFLTHNRIGTKLFRRVVERPQLFLSFANVLHSLRLVGDKQYRFARANFETPEQRRKVYNVWMIFRNILPDMHLAKKAAEQYQVKIHLIFGRFDTIIRAAWGIDFLIGLETPSKIDVLDTGHNLVKENTMMEIAAII